MRVEVEGEIAAEDILAEVPRGAGFLERLFEAQIDFEDFTVDVVVAAPAPHGITGDDHALDDGVRVVAQDVAILESARLALVGVAHDVLLARKLPRHEAPLQAGGEARTAAAAQPRSLDFLDHLLRRHVLRQEPTQGRVAAARFVVF